MSRCVLGSLSLSLSLYIYIYIYILLYIFLSIPYPKVLSRSLRLIDDRPIDVRCSLQAIFLNASYPSVQKEETEIYSRLARQSQVIVPR
jgi:hypothetical protein